MKLSLTTIWDGLSSFPGKQIPTVGLFTALLVLHQLLPLVLIATVNFGQTGAWVNFGWAMPFELIIIGLGISFWAAAL